MNFFIKNKKIIIPLTILFLLAGIICIAIVACTNKNIDYDDYTIYKGVEGKIEKYDSTKVVEGYNGGNKAYYIEGDIKSSSDKNFIIIIYDLYDKKNTKLGIAKAILTNVKAKEKYHYKAIGLIDSSKVNDVSYYKFNKVTENIIKDI